MCPTCRKGNKFQLTRRCHYNIFLSDNMLECLQSQTDALKSESVATLIQHDYSCCYHKAIVQDLHWQMFHLKGHSVHQAIQLHVNIASPITLTFRSNDYVTTTVSTRRHLFPNNGWTMRTKDIVPFFYIFRPQLRLSHSFAIITCFSISIVDYFCHFLCLCAVVLQVVY